MTICTCFLFSILIAPTSSLLLFNLRIFVSMYMGIYAFPSLSSCHLLLYYIHYVNQSLHSHPYRILISLELIRKSGPSDTNTTKACGGTQWSGVRMNL